MHNIHRSAAGGNGVLVRHFDSVQTEGTLRCVCPHCMPFGVIVLDSGVVLKFLSGNVLFDGDN